MVALVFLHFAGIVFVFLANRDRLCCACFAATGVACARKHACRCSLGGHAHQGALHHGHMLWFVAQINRSQRRHGNFLARHRVLRGNHQARRVFDASVGQNGCGLCQLQHSKGVVALANAQ